jgi:putative acetyltransferase
MRPDLTIAPERPEQLDVIAMLEARDAYSAALYPPESNHALDLVGLLDPSVTFLVARSEGDAVGCGAVVRHGEGEGELKSMWVEPDRRGAGLGHALLSAAEAAARAHGIRVLRLETGVRQPEALGLYRAAGYREVPAYNQNPKADLWFERSLRRSAQE